jgi:nucleoside-diphosphate-sugar epimerase
MRVFATGGTGAIGGHTVPALVAAGHDVTAMARRVRFCAVGGPLRFMLRSAWTECQRIRTEGSATVVDAALAAGVWRVVQESVAMIYHDGGDRWIDEDWPVDHYPIAAGNHAAESNARRFAESGRDAVVLRFGLFYGPGAAHSEQIMPWHVATSHSGPVGATRTCHPSISPTRPAP